MRDRRPKFKSHGTDEGPNILRVELVTDLMCSLAFGEQTVWQPGGVAQARIIHWYGQVDHEWPSFDEFTPNQYQTSEAEIEIIDPLQIAFGFAGASLADGGDRLWVIFKRDSGKFEVLQPCGLVRHVVLEETLEAGRSAAAVVRVSTGETGGALDWMTTDKQIRLWDDLLDDDVTLPAGTRIQATWRTDARHSTSLGPSHGRWFIGPAACSPLSPWPET